MVRKNMLFSDLNYKDFKVTNEIRKRSIGNYALPAIQKLGLFRTDDETKKYISKSLKRKLP